MVAKHREPPPPFRTVRRSPHVTDLVFAGKKAVRSRISKRDRRMTEHYAADGTLVKISLYSEETDRELSRRVDEAVRRGDVWTGIAGAAERLGVHPTTLRRAAREGKLKTRRIGRSWITSVAWMQEYAANRRPAGRPRKIAKAPTSSGRPRGGRGR